MIFIDANRLNEFYVDGVLPIKQDLILHNTAITELQSAVLAEQNNIDDLEIAVESLQNSQSVGGGLINAYIRTGATEYGSSWLSDTSSSGSALTPRDDVLYIIVSSGDEYGRAYRWDSTENEYTILKAVQDSIATETEILNMIASYSGQQSNNSSGGGIINAYIRTGSTALSSSWL